MWEESDESQAGQRFRLPTQVGSRWEVRGKVNDGPRRVGRCKILLPSASREHSTLHAEIRWKF